MKSQFLTTLLLIWILLSVSVSAEGQVTIEKKSDSYVGDTPLVANKRDLFAIFRNGGIWVTKNGVAIDASLEILNTAHTYTIGGPTQMEIQGSLVVSNTWFGAMGRAENTVAIFDLDNLNPIIDYYGNPTIPQNWEIENRNLGGFGQFFFVNEYQNLLGINHDFGVQVFRMMGDKSVVQDIQPNLNSPIIGMVGKGDFFAVSDGMKIFLYHFDGTEYVPAGEFAPFTYSNPTSYGRFMSMSFSNSGELLLVAGVQVVVEVRVINPVNMYVLKKLAMSSVDDEKLGHMFAVTADGEFGILGYDKLVHIPTLSILGNIPLREPDRDYDGMYKSCSISLEVFDYGKSFRMYIAESIGNDGWLSKFEEPIRQARFSVSPRNQQGNSVWGSVSAERSEYFLDGDDLTFIIASRDAKKVIDRVAHRTIADEKKVPAAKGKGSLVYTVPTALGDQTIEATFVKAPAKIRARAQKAVTEEPIRIVGLKKTELREHLLLPGDYIGYDDGFGYRYEIHVPKSGKVGVKMTRVPGFIRIK